MKTITIQKTMTQNSYTDLTLLVGLAKHLYEFQETNVVGTCIDNSLILAQNLYASGITDIDITVGTIVGLMGTPPFPTMRPHVWVSRGSDVLDNSAPTHEMSSISYFPSYANAFKYYSHIISAIIGHIDLEKAKRTHLAALMNFRKILKDQNYSLVENEYVQKYQKYCEEDPLMYEINK